MMTLATLKHQMFPSAPIQGPTRKSGAGLMWIVEHGPVEVKSDFSALKNKNRKTSKSFEDTMLYCGRIMSLYLQSPFTDKKNPEMRPVLRAVDVSSLYVLLRVCQYGHFGAKL